MSRVRKLIFVFKNLGGVADLDCLKTIYFSLAQSILYCNTARGGDIKTLMLRVERAQKAVLKVMHSVLRHFSTDFTTVAVRQL